MYFTLAIIKETDQNIDELLYPYFKGRKVEPYILQTKEEIINESKKARKRLLKELKYKDYDELEDYEQIIIDCITDDDFYYAQDNIFRKYDQEGNLLSTYNPQSKYSRYKAGDKIIKLKNNQYTNQCLIKDIDYDYEFKTRAVLENEVWYDRRQYKDDNYMDRFIKPNIDKEIVIIECYIKI
jgi:hypothetical protein